MAASEFCVKSEDSTSVFTCEIGLKIGVMDTETGEAEGFM